MKDVVVYSASWCAGCQSLKKYLDNKSITYRQVLLDDKEGMLAAKENGVRTIPVTFVDGVRIDGSSVNALEIIVKEVGV